jgi:hypothetical protein
MCRECLFCGGSIACISSFADGPMLLFKVVFVVKNTAYGCFSKWKIDNCPMRETAHVISLSVFYGRFESFTFGET